MKSIGILLFLLVFLIVLIGLPIILGIKIYKGFKQSGLAIRDAVINGKAATATITQTSTDTSGRGLRRIVEYEFEVDGQTYRGNTTDRELERGDKIEIEYDSTDPSKNFPAEIIAEARRTAPKGLRDRI